MGGVHSRLGASGAHRWIPCPASVRACEGEEDKSSIFAAYGSVAHDVSAVCLTHDGDPAKFLGQSYEQDGFTIKVDQEMVDGVRKYLALIKMLIAQEPGSVAIYEQRVDYSNAIGMPESGGTSDTIILGATTLTSVDLKFGQGEPVYAENNPQTRLYSVGALNEFGAVQDFTHVRSVICMPRLGDVKDPYGWVTEETLTVAELNDWVETVVKPAAQRTRDPEAEFVPGEKQCRWCSHKPRCEAAREAVFEGMGHVAPATPDEFGPGLTGAIEAATTLRKTDPAWVAKAMDNVDFIEKWCASMRAEAERLLVTGVEVPGYKLVRGRQGPRKWKNAEEAEAQMKAWRLRKDEMYDLVVMSPTSAEKFFKDNPKRWAALQAQIDRSDGTISVAPATDARPAVDMIAKADEFGPPTEPEPEMVLDFV